MKKIFIVIILFLSIFGFAQAVPAQPKTVEGTVPEVQPLQPVRPGIIPSLNGKFQNAQPENIDDSGNFSQQTPQVTATQRSAPKNKSTGPGYAVIWLLVFLAVLGLIALAARYFNKIKK